jgi:hypothetical protein
VTDWRLPENRRESFLAFYRFQLEHKAHPGLVYFWLPAMAEEYNLDTDEARTWLVWLNGNTQNPVTTLLLLQEAPTPEDWPQARYFFNTYFRELEWDTDRRHQKSKFVTATEQWLDKFWRVRDHGWFGDWDTVWRYSLSQPYMGRLSAWSMLEYARILLGPEVPDAATWMLEDKSGSKSHRNGMAVVAGYDAVYWDDEPFMLDMLPELESFADGLLEEMQGVHPDVSRLTLESAFCTYKSHYKPNRRYPGVYADMAYCRLRRAEKFFGQQFDLLWESRRQNLPPYLRLEDSPYDPGLVPTKQNWFRETGEFPVLGRFWEPAGSTFNDMVDLGLFGRRQDAE